MPVSFPALKPSNRTITLGIFPVKKFRSINGTQTQRRYGTLPSSSTIELEYSNITDSDTYLLCETANQAYGTFDTLTLPPEFLDDIEEPLRSLLQSTYIWRFIEIPDVSNSSIPGYKSVSIRLEGQRD